MNKRFRSFLLTIPLLTIGLFFFFLTYGTALAQEKSFHWEHDDVEIEVDGSFRVLEHQHGAVTGSAPAWQARADQKDGATDAETAGWTTKDMLIIGFSLLLFCKVVEI